MFNYSKLRGKIREVFHTERDFAKEMGFSKQTLSAKLNGKIEFTQSEIAKATSLLEIPQESIPDIFFNAKVKHP